MACECTTSLPPPPSAKTLLPSEGNEAAMLQIGGRLLDFIRSVIVNKQESTNYEPFYVLDLGALKSLMDRWTRNLPTVQPFYAVKCNPDPLLLRSMTELGTSFDCASQAEIEAVLSFGVAPDRIIFANPCKTEAHLKYSAQVGVNLTTFDSTFEVSKIKKHHPNCKLLIRIKAPDNGDAKFPLGKKYGALLEEVEALLRAAQAARLLVVGVSFHIGSGARRGDAYKSAIEAARKVFDAAASIGMPKMRMLNVGGGFTAGEQFEMAADTIKSAVAEYFEDEPGLTVIAEPGRFFSETIFTLAVNIFGKRLRGELREYWINDGVWGSMNCVLYGDPMKDPTPFACKSNPDNPTYRGESEYKSTVFGPTCDAYDTVFKDYNLPELQIGDWMIFPEMGAYTKTCGSNFNGFNTTEIQTNVLGMYRPETKSRTDVDIAFKHT